MEHANVFFILCITGIIVGLGLIAFSVANRKKLPLWSIIAFSVVGLGIIASSSMIAIGIKSIQYL